MTAAEMVPGLPSAAGARAVAAAKGAPPYLAAQPKKGCLTRDTVQSVLHLPQVEAAKACGLGLTIVRSHQAELHIAS